MMGWISKRAYTSGHALYDEGPKRKGPLRNIIEFTSTDRLNMFGCDTGWLECGHWCNRIYGRERAICEKCRLGKPKDKKRKDGWPN